VFKIRTKKGFCSFFIANGGKRRYAIGSYINVLEQKTGRISIFFSVFIKAHNCFTTQKAVSLSVQVAYATGVIFSREV
jgi:hypothetical protein